MRSTDRRLGCGSVTRTRVARCREEALWACESVCAPGLTCWEEARASEFTLTCQQTDYVSKALRSEHNLTGCALLPQGLLIHGECSIVESGGDTRGVTGGEVEALRL
jgi:hypothetical protein